MRAVVARPVRALAAILLAVGLAACGSSSRTTAHGPCSAKPVANATLARDVREFVRDYGLPGAVAELCTPAGKAQVASGLSDRRAKTAMRPSDAFWVGSVTKTFVATVVLQLVAEHRLSLGDTVERRLPGIVPRGREVTIRELLNHTSGIPDFFGDARVQRRLARNPRGFIPSRELIARAVSHPLEFPPGHDWQYSNTNYLLLGLIVEKATGKSLGDNLRTRIFEPLGLHDTTFAAARRGERMRGYDISADPAGRDVTYVNVATAGAAGGIVSTTDDVGRFFSALFGGKLLSARELHSMETVALDASNDGLGVFRMPTDADCGRSWGHGGAVPGYLTVALASADGRRVVVAATNASNDSTQRALVQMAAAAFCGQ
jgi:D-alanyl-D-alanine carboxypeptidase